MIGNKTSKILTLALAIAIFSVFSLTETAQSFNLKGIKNFAHTKRIKKQKKVKKHPSIDTRQRNYIELESLDLTENSTEKFDEIYSKEARDLRPLALDLEAKYIRLDELNAMHCRFYQRKCKRNLKAKYEFIEPQIKEVERQIWLKKESYKTQYLNATTRAQDIKLRKMIYNKTGGNMKLW